MVEKESKLLDSETAGKKNQTLIIPYLSRKNKEYQSFSLKHTVSDV